MQVAALCDLIIISMSFQMFLLFNEYYREKGNKRTVLLCCYQCVSFSFSFFKACVFFSITTILNDF